MAIVQESQSAAQKKETRNTTATKTTGISLDKIAARAYQIWQANGRPDGHDQDHWFQAERELRASQGARATRR